MYSLYIFHEWDDLSNHGVFRPAVNPTQSKTSPLQGRRRQRRKKQQKQLPPVHRQGPATADIQFHFPKL